MTDTDRTAVTATPAAPETQWHLLTCDDVLARLESSPDGLTSPEAAARLEQHGPNELVERGARSPWRILWEQLTAVMVLILIGAALLSLALQKYLEAGAIGAIVVLFALLGFAQEYRAEQAIAALRRMVVPSVRVVRDGRRTDVPAGSLVPGDVVHLEAGTVVPADLRVLESVDLRVQEAMLTGESDAVDKRVTPVEGEDLALGDRVSMAYSGTQVVYGRGVGVAVATGMETELGHIATLLQEVDAKRTPLQERLDRVGKQLALAGLAVAALVVAMGAAGGESFSDLVLTAISVAVAVIPEGLPAVVTFTLAIGAQRMLRRNSLIRRLPAVETLGSVTVICSDKTGTLTENRMAATMVEVAGRRIDLDALDDGMDDGMDESQLTALRLTLAAGALCNDGELAGEGDEDAIGDPTETALLFAARRAGIEPAELRAAVPRVAERPFDSERKRMSTVHGPLRGEAPQLAALDQDVRVAFVKGAIDGLLDHATQVWAEGGPRPLDAEVRERIAAANEAMAADGLRVLGVAYHTMSADEAVADAENELVVLGLVGIIDPPRAEVRDAVARCRTAGIRPVMITGDHPATALAIARDLGISRDERVVTGPELDRLDEQGLDALVGEVSVFARVSPEHKLRLVEALRERGHVVAMTGDGVNDAPALKRADIGVAMGITGTDVSKEAADMVLRDDNFATIVAAVEEGRVIYDNLRRFVSFAVAGNLGKIIVMLGWPVPYLLTGGDADSAVALLPLQLLWLNLMTDGLLGLSMGVEPAERGVMARPPHAPGGSLWSGGLGARTTWVGALIGATALAIGFAYHESGNSEWQTMVVVSLAFLQVFQAIGTRSDTESLTTIGVFTNPVMNAIVALVVGLQFLAIYGPLQGFLDLEALGVVDVAIALGSGVALLVVLELTKVPRRRAAGRRPGLADGGIRQV